MELMPSPTGSADPEAELLRLRRELERERSRRLAAESRGEQATAELYASLRELRSAQTELIERADQSRMVAELARLLREDLDSQHLVNRAAEVVGRATTADRCEVLLVDAEPTSAVRGSWCASDEAASLPSPQSFVALPEVLTTLMLEAAQDLSPVQIDHIDEDERFDPEAAAEVVAALGIRALAAVPVAVGDEVVGWMMLQSIVPRPWQPGELAICESLSHDLVASVIQVRAFEHQRESVRRLQELDHAKDAFISTVSHELRTPLTSIVGYLELISEEGLGPLTEELSRGVRIIERNVARLRALVEDLLQHSAYDAGKVNLDVRPFDLAGLLADCAQNLAPAMAERRLVLVTDVDPNCRRCWETASRSRAWCSTCSATPPSSATWDTRSTRACAPRPTPSCSPSPTPGSASRRLSTSGSSRASSVRPWPSWARSRAPGSASPWCGRWWSRTTARWNWSPSRARAPPSR